MATVAVTKAEKPPKPPGDVGRFAEAAECLKTLSHTAWMRGAAMLLHGRFTVAAPHLKRQMACIEGRFLAGNRRNVAELTHFRSR